MYGIIFLMLILLPVRKSPLSLVAKVGSKMRRSCSHKRWDALAVSSSTLDHISLALVILNSSASFPSVVVLCSVFFFFFKFYFFKNQKGDAGANVVEL